MKEDIVIIIPTYNPNEELYKLIKKLKENKYSKIILINDGSENIEIFSLVQEDVILLKHENNKGKGRALKTGMKYCLENFYNIIGIITVDADGQHLLEDINKIYEELKKNKENVILGTRNFNNKQIPLKSRIGNKIFSKIIKRKLKIEIKDTQTGLRGVPLKYIKQFIKVNGERFEYETNIILYCIKNFIKMEQIDVKTIYINKNKASNYKSIKDSIEIINQLKNYVK